MARTANYSVLKKYLPKEQFDENYALISHYIQLQGTDKAKKNEKKILAKNVDLSLIPRKTDFNKSVEIPYTNKDEKFTFIDLFAGIGGIRLGFERAFGENSKTVFVSEWDKFAQQTYKANFEDDFEIAGDITKIDEKSIPLLTFVWQVFRARLFQWLASIRGSMTITRAFAAERFLWMWHGFANITSRKLFSAKM